MVTILSPTTIYQIFTLAAGADDGARLVSPGNEGVLNILNTCLPCYAITSTHIVRVYDDLRLEAECSFSYVEFEYFVNQLFCILQREVDSRIHLADHIP